MFRKTRNIVLVAGALAAVSFAGSALANAGAAPTGNTNAIKTTIAKAGAHATKHHATSASTATAGDTETADGPESADQETSDGRQSGSEASENDGPGGHADEPGNPNANHEASGQE